MSTDGGWNAETLAASLAGGRFGAALIVVEETASTNDLAWVEARRGAPDGLLVLADRQTRGRGRGANDWHSPKGQGIWASFLLRPSWPASRSALVPLAAGVALAEAAERAGVRAGLKWPNDLLAGAPPRKLGGVLTESRSDGDGRGAVVIGIGINVGAQAADFPPPLRERATSLSIELCGPVDRAAVLGDLALALERHVTRLDDGQESELIDAWRARAVLLGRAVRVRGGGAEVLGIARDVAGDGALVVRLDSGVEVAVHAGEVDVLWDTAGARSG